MTFRTNALRCATPRRAIRPRLAISVMEVLIAIAIVAIGLLGIIAMLPLGYMFAQNAIRADHSLAMAERGFHEIMVHRWLSRLDFDTNPGPVALDPLAFNSGELGGSTLPRDNTIIPSAMAKEVLVSSDDLSYDRDQTDPTQVIYTVDDTTNLNYDPGASTPVLPPLKNATHGDYSVLATVVPQGGNVAKVSVAAFYKRNVANETWVKATSLGGSLVELEYDTLDTDNTAGKAAVKRLKKNQWILLENAATGFYGWYRIIVVADGDNQDWTGSGGSATTKAWVTVEGTNLPTVDRAVLFDQVLSVYERTVAIR